MRQVPLWGPTNIKGYSTEFSRTGFVHPSCNLISKWNPIVLLWWTLQFLCSFISLAFILTNDCKTDNMWKYIFMLGTPWPRIWLRHCATSRKVAGLVSLEFWHGPSGRTLALGSTQPPNRNKYQKHFVGGKGGRCVGLTTLPTSYADRLEIWEPQPSGTHRPCNKSEQGFPYLWNFYAMLQNSPLSPPPKKRHCCMGSSQLPLTCPFW
jgi:hypothetical protein